MSFHGSNLAVVREQHVPEKRQHYRDAEQKMKEKLAKKAFRQEQKKAKARVRRKVLREASSTESPPPNWAASVSTPGSEEGSTSLYSSESASPAADGLHLRGDWTIDQWASRMVFGSSGGSLELNDPFAMVPATILEEPSSQIKLSAAPMIAPPLPKKKNKSRIRKQNPDLVEEKNPELARQIREAAQIVAAKAADSLVLADLNIKCMDPSPLSFSESAPVAYDWTNSIPYFDNYWP